MPPRSHCSQGIVVDHHLPMDGRAVRARQVARAGHPPVSHGFAALGVYTAGRARVELAGEWRVGVGDVLLVPAGSAHRLLAAEGAEYWGLALWAPSARAAASGLVDPFERVRDGGAAVVSIPAARQAFLESLLQELAQASGPPAVRESLVTLVLGEVQRALGPPSGAPGLVSASLGYIERHALRPRTVAEVAEAVGRTPTHLTTALRRATGRTVTAWITLTRLAEARRLLQQTALGVEDVAERVGYGDATHFIRMFRRHHGVTPAAWRAAAG